MLLNISIAFMTFVLTCVDQLSHALFILTIKTAHKVAAKRLGFVYIKRQRQHRDDASDIALIGKNGVTPKFVSH